MRSKFEEGCQHAFKRPVRRTPFGKSGVGNLLILSAYVIAVVKIVKNRIHVVLRDASI